MKIPLILLLFILGSCGKTDTTVYTTRCIKEDNIIELRYNKSKLLYLEFVETLEFIEDQDDITVLEDNFNKLNNYEGISFSIISNNEHDFIYQIIFNVEKIDTIPNELKLIFGNYFNNIKTLDPLQEINSLKDNHYSCDYWALVFTYLNEFVIVNM